MRIFPSIGLLVEVTNFIYNSTVTINGTPPAEGPSRQMEPSDHTTHEPRPAWILWAALGGILIFICAAGLVTTWIFVGPRVLDEYLPQMIQTAEGQTRQISHHNTMGDPNAPIHMIEYGDFQCPFCLKFWHETEPLLIKEYVNTGKVFFEYRPIALLGPESELAGEGAYCAGDQGRFWEYHDTLFANWSGENVGDFAQEKLIQYAKTMGLDMDLFEPCLSRGDHKRTVEQDAARAQADGVLATPTFIINGEKIEGAQPYLVLKHIIDELLNGDLNTQNG